MYKRALRQGLLTSALECKALLKGRLVVAIFSGYQEAQVSLSLRVLAFFPCR